jgi:hypothetical protein
MQGESFTFHGLWTQMRIMKVDPIEREIAKPKKDIFDIQVINVFMLNTYSRFCVFDTNSRLLENKTFCVRIT